VTAELSDEQLKRILRGIAALHLEVERGVRDPDLLAERLPPQARYAWRQHRRAELPLPGGAAGDDELGPAHLGRDAQGRVFASVTTPTQTGRWGALSFVLDVHRGRVAVRQIQRLHARRDYGRNPSAARDQPPVEVPLEEQLRRANMDREHVDAALAAASKRLDQMPARSPERGETARTRDNWRRVRDELDRELSALRTRQQARGQTEPPRRSR
jgi:hypothetical protein